MKSVICYFPHGGHTEYKGKVYSNEELADLLAHNLRNGATFPIPDHFTLCVLDVGVEEGEEWKNGGYDD